MSDGLVPAGWSRSILAAMVGTGLVIIAAFIDIMLRLFPGAPPATAAGPADASRREAGRVLWRPLFPPARALVTNELAATHPDTPGVRRSADWLVTSGSLFDDGGVGWTGALDGSTPDAASERHTDSAVFRVVSRPSQFGDVRVSLDLDVLGMTTTRRTPAQPYDGVHIFLRYHSPQQLYAVSVDRRDHTVVVKKKLPGGPSNGGTYTTLAQSSFTCPHGTWVHEQAEVQNVGGNVVITLSTNGRPLLRAVDHGQGGPPITLPGRVGLRGDNTNFRFRDFVVSALR